MKFLVKSKRNKHNSKVIKVLFLNFKRLIESPLLRIRFLLYFLGFIFKGSLILLLLYFWSFRITILMDWLLKLFFDNVTHLKITHFSLCYLDYIFLIAKLKLIHKTVI